MSGAIFTRLSDVKPEPVRWLWEGRVPLGKVTLLEGEPGVGKSALVLELAARVSRGAPMPLYKGSEAPPANVVIFCEDDSLADTVRPRLEAAEADLTRIYSIDREVSAEDVVPLRPALIILDPLSAYVCLSCEHSPVEVMRKLGALARQTGAAVLATMSVAAGTADESEHAEFYGTPRSVIHLSPIGHGGRRIAISKANLLHLPDIHPIVYYLSDDDDEVRIVNWSDGR
jgi:hypothetical protein